MKKAKTSDQVPIYGIWGNDTVINGERRGLILDTIAGGRNLADIFIDETNKYYKAKKIPIPVIFLAAEFFVKAAFMDISSKFGIKMYYKRPFADVVRL